MVPACVTACPASAITKDADTGVVFIDAELCSGSKTCIEACPYEVPQWLEDQGISAKCDMCAAFRANGETPACVNACPLRVLEWGNIDELKAKYPDAVMDLPVLPSSSDTVPAAIISPRSAALEPDFRRKFI